MKTVLENDKNTWPCNINGSVKVYIKIDGKLKAGWFSVNDEDVHFLCVNDEKTYRLTYINESVYVLPKNGWWISTDDFLPSINDEVLIKTEQYGLLIGRKNDLDQWEIKTFLNHSKDKWIWGVDNSLSVFSWIPFFMVE